MITKAILAFRTGRIGGSDLPSLLGKAKFTGPATLAQRILNSSNKNSLYNPLFEFGNRWESEIAQLFAENHPEFIVISIQDAYEKRILSSLPGFVARPKVLEDGSVVLLDQYSDLLVLNADYLLISRFGIGWGILECKTGSEYAADQWGPTGTDLVPSWYEDQPKHYCARMGGDFVYLAVLIGLRDYREYKLTPYTAAESDAVVNTVTAWYERHITNRTPVPPTFQDYDNAAICEESLVAGPDLMNTMLELKEVESQLKPLIKRKEELTSKIKGEAATYGQVVTADGELIYSHKETTHHVFDADALARQDPATYAKYLTTQTSRRFSKSPGFKNLMPTVAIFKTAING